MKDHPIVILTALNLEYQAVRKHLTDIEVRTHPAGTRFEVGRLGRDGCRVALSLVGKGNHSSAVLAERAMTTFEPPVVIFVGVAGALWPGINLGDVVVASHVYAYQGGTSEDDGLKARPRVWEISHECDQIAKHLDRTGAWASSMPSGIAKPTVRFGPVAAGEIVQDSAISAEARWVRQTYNDALAIEMESAGLAQAAHLNRSLPAVVVRGISDRADGTKTTTDGADWQPKAAANAALFAVALATELNRTGTDTRTREGKDTPMSGAVTNIAKGQSRVGVQAGTVHGGIVVGESSPAGPAAVQDLLTDLREQVALARAAGELDQDTFVAAEEELETIIQALPPQGERAPRRPMIALQRLRGLLMDWAELATKVTAVVVGLRGTA
jgi:adenosylhomocysteine nucleosidase